jgi:hypothetical protein
LEIKPAKIVKEKGICKLAAEYKEAQEDEEGWYNEVSLIENEVCYIPTPIDSWYYELKYYLTHGSAPQYLEPRK